jgi:WD40 repeat protein
VDRIALAVAPQGQLAAWTTPSPKVLLSAEEAGDVPSPAVRPPESITGQQQVVVFDLAKQAIRFVASGHTSPIQALTFSADGRRLASGDSTGILKLWDTETGSELLSMDAHLNGVSAIAIHPGGRQMASVGGDAVVRLWRTE